MRALVGGLLLALVACGGSSYNDAGGATSSGRGEGTDEADEYSESRYAGDDFGDTDPVYGDDDYDGRGNAYDDGQGQVVSDPFPEVSAFLAGFVDACSRSGYGADDYIDWWAAGSPSQQKKDAVRACEDVLKFLSPSSDGSPTFRVDRYVASDDYKMAYTVVFPNGYTGTTGYYFVLGWRGGKLGIRAGNYGECPAPGASFMPYACESY